MDIDELDMVNPVPLYGAGTAIIDRYVTIKVSSDTYSPSIAIRYALPSDRHRTEAENSRPVGAALSATRRPVTLVAMCSGIPRFPYFETDEG